MGVSIDKQLNMHSQVSQTLNSGSRDLNTIKIISPLSGVNSKILLITFHGCTRACLDYGAECFNMCTLTQMRQLQRKQNNGLKLVLGVNMGPNFEHTCRVNNPPFGPPCESIPSQYDKQVSIKPKPPSS